MKHRKGLILKAVFTLCVCLLLVSCGGGGGGSVSSYAISGKVTLSGSGLAGVTVSLTGAATTSTTTDSSGNYSFTSSANGSYTLTPSLTGYTFSPTSTAVTVSGANATGKDFTATSSDSSYPVNGACGSSNGTTVSAAPSSNLCTTGTYTTVSGSGPWTWSCSGSNGGTTASCSASKTSSSGGSVQLPKTGQTTSYATGDDGALQKGVAWPNPRFTDNGNGTVTDSLTGLVWLKNANCFSTQTWTAALTSANALANGQCGLTDGSTAGQWRLPNRKELRSLVDYANYNPALPTGHPFSNVQSYVYWSGTTYASDTSNAWDVGMPIGDVYNDVKANAYYVWPVR